MVGRQTPLLALLLPFILLGIVDGRRGIRQAWPVALVGGFPAFATAQFICSNHVSVALTDITASIWALAAIAALLHVWTPAEPLLAQPARGLGTAHDSRRDILRAYAPYLVILAVFSIAQLPAVKRAFAGSPWTESFQWPGLDVRTPDGAVLPSVTFRFDWLPGVGTLMLIAGLITMAVIGLSPGRALRVGRADAYPAQRRDPGRDRRPRARLCRQPVRSDAHARPRGGASRPDLRVPRAGHRVARRRRDRNRDTASNALFGGVQVVAANHTEIPATLLAAANASGGVLGKDDLGAAPRHRGCGGRHRGTRGRALSQDCGLEHRPAAVRLRARLPAIDVSPGVDGAQVRRRGLPAPKERE